MKIEFSVEEYFEQLKLMSEQYGMEEELYPWIYMLLQMAEVKKQKILNEQYVAVSIRDVHNWKKVGKLSDVLPKRKQKMEFMVKRCPDIAVFNLNGTHFEGCVEIKKFIDGRLNLKNGKYIISESGKDILELKEKRMQYTCNIKNIVEKIKEAYDVKECLCDMEWKEGLIKSIDENLKNNDIFDKKISYRGKNHDERKFDVVTDLEIREEIKDILKKQQSISAKIGEYELDKIKITIEEEKQICKDEPQIIEHLKTYKKGLYTNGLEFYLLRLEEDKKIIEVKEIADLTSLYECYQKRDGSISNDTLLAVSTEWDRLIAGLTSIDWHKDPVVEIPSAQMSIQE